MFAHQNNEPEPETLRTFPVHIFDKLTLRYGDLTDSSNLLNVLTEIKNTYSDIERLEVYNLGAMSHVKISFEMPEYVADTDGIGTLRLLEAVRILGLEKKTRIYQASTSEMFGGSRPPQNEKTIREKKVPDVDYNHWL